MEDNIIPINRNHNIIDITEYYEIEYWASRFNVRPEQIRAAVLAVGSSITSVEHYLNKKAS
ncbi:MULTISPECIES: DUF3606 domain-containing protein [Mucilaginibacter]|uniref:DUF3606 domain-containing protein n=1 Tax=Mucilaginibacter TaxID=423349 RepID=UPI0020927F55|nr:MULTISPECIES: DUF3606 domain-containing protein [Mucilaginibacter]MCO5949788.1 DUF3606 domain-containing protein [Mucilaginibacter flavidus]